VCGLGVLAGEGGGVGTGVGEGGGQCCRTVKALELGFTTQASDSSRCMRINGAGGVCSGIWE
jgi:hypothetical protein